MKKIVLVIVLVLNFLPVSANFSEEESAVFYDITSYSEKHNYLTKDEERLLEELRKQDLKFGYEIGNSAEAKALKIIFKRHLDIDLVLVEQSWFSLLKSMKNGEIDFISNLSFTGERSEYIEYTDSYYNSKVFMVYPENINLSREGALKDKKLIYTDGSIHFETFKHLKKRYEIELIPKSSSSLEDIKDDTYIVCDRLQIYSLTENGYTHLRYKEFFNTDPVHFGMSKKMEESYRKLLKKLLNSYINERIRVFLDTYLNYIENRFASKMLNNEELKFIRNLKVLNIGVDREQYYISYKSAKEKKYKGALFDLVKNHYKLMERIEYPEVNSIQEKINLLKSKPNSMVLLPINIRNTNRFNLSEPLYSLEYFQVKDRYRKERNGIVGIATTSYYLDDFLYQVIDRNYKIFNSSSELLEALESGEIGSALMSENDIKYFQNEKLKTFLEIHKRVGSIQVGIATNRENIILSDVVKKFAKYIFIKDDFMKKWKYTPNLVGIEYKRKVKQLSLLTGILGILLIFLLLTVRKLYKYNFYDLNTGLPSIKLIRRTIKKNKNSGLITFSIGNTSEILNSFSEDEALDKFKEIISKLSFPVYYISRNQYAMFSKNLTQEELLSYSKEFIKTTKSYYLGNIKVEFNYGLSHISSSKTTEDLIKNALYSLHLFTQNKRLIEGNPEVLKEHKAHKKFQRELEEAILKDKFLPYFQPKLDVKSGKIKGAEILSRYINEEGKFISPGIFIPILEEINIINKLDLIILKKSLLIIKDFLDRGYVEKYFVISQNLSVKTLEDEKIVKKIQNIIGDVGFPLENLEFEVTETAVSKNMQKISKNLTQIKNLGVSISLDDFSAGNSSVSYINHLPIDIIKFDMSILPKSEDETASINIFTALSKTFKELEYEIVAEGVETEWQNDFISKHKIDTGQGYYYSKPLEKEQLRVFLENS